MTYNMIKTQFFLHQTLDYSQIYNFTLDHGYKFKIIIMFKDVWISKSKSLHVFLFFECLEHMDPFLWKKLKFTKKKEMIWWIFDKEKRLLKQKTTYPHAFLECFKHIKGLLKHGGFSWKFYSYNFQSIRIYLKN
jgi:hypothetical protein